VVFVDRAEAGRRLGRAVVDAVGAYPEHPVAVLALTRGGVPVGAEVARALNAPLDVVVVRKLGVPWHPELAMGAIAEGPGGSDDVVRLLNDAVIARAGVRPDDLRQVEDRERAELQRRARAYRTGRAPVDVAGRTAVNVDDGVATGATARAACRSARARGAVEVVLATPVAPPGIETQMQGEADRVICVETPEDFRAVGHHYARFDQVSDDEVVAALGDAEPHAAS
jgi:predicted phosphoribosyltransferase